MTNELPHDLPYDLRLYGRLKTLRLKNLEITKLGNISKISHLVGNVAKGPVFLPYIELQSRNETFLIV